MRDHFQAGRFSVEVLYLDNHLLGLVKPPNLPVQRDASGDPDLLTCAKEYVARKFHKPGDVYLGLVHRLDRPVGGVMVLARTSKAAARLSQAFARHTLDKRYLAVVQGYQGGEMALRDFLCKDPRTGMVRVVSPDTPGGKEARLISRPLAARRGLTLIQVELQTGRAHQIRVQQAHAGFPLWGDARYGGGKPGQQIALWAHRLVLDHPVAHQALALEVSPPGGGIWDLFKDAWEEIHES